VVRVPLQLPPRSRRQAPSPDDAFGSDEVFAQRQNLLGFAAQDEHFEAEALIQVYMEAADDVGVVSVLYVREFLSQVGGVMLKHHQDGGHALAVFVAAFPSVADKLSAQQVPNGFGAVFITASLDEGVEL